MKFMSDFAVVPRQLSFWILQTKLKRSGFDQFEVDSIF